MGEPPIPAAFGGMGIGEPPIPVALGGIGIGEPPIPATARLNPTLLKTMSSANNNARA